MRASPKTDVEVPAEVAEVARLMLGCIEVYRATWERHKPVAVKPEGLDDFDEPIRERLRRNFAVIDEFSNWLHTLMYRLDLPAVTVDGHLFICDDTGRLNAQLVGTIEAIHVVPVDSILGLGGKGGAA